MNISCDTQKKVIPKSVLASLSETSCHGSRITITPGVSFASVLKTRSTAEPEVQTPPTPSAR